MTLRAYNTGHISCATVLGAFARGSQAELVACDKFHDGPAAFYGILRGSGELVHAARKGGREWFYCDNGYLRPGHFEGYFRVSRNAYQYHRQPEPMWDRWRALGMQLDPWRKDGRHVLVCPPSSAYCAHHGIAERGWMNNILEQIRAVTDRPIRQRAKSRRTSLAEDLRDCHALVTHASNSAIEALRAGVPVVTTGDCAATRLATPLQELEHPSRPDREEWFATLAGQQWLLEEFRDGTMWRAIRGHR